MKKPLGFLLFLWIYLLSHHLVFAQVRFPLEAVAISDNINVFDSSQKVFLSNECKAFYETKKVQIAVTLIPAAWRGTLSIEEYSIQLAEKRKLGNKELDSGVLVLIVGSPEDSTGRGVRIEVGYGLEARLTDLEAKKLIDTYIIPNLKNGDYYKACELAVQEIKNLLEDFDDSTTGNAEETNKEDIPEQTQKSEETTEIPWFYFSLWTMVIGFLMYGLGLLAPSPHLFTPIAVYPACTALNFLLIHVKMPMVLHIILFFMISLFIPALMLHIINLRYPEDNQDQTMSLNGLGFFMYLFVTVFLMALGFYYMTLEEMYLAFFGGTVLSLFVTIPLIMLADIADLEGDIGSTGLSSVGGVYSGSSSSSSGGGYSGGGSSSSSGGGRYSGGGGSFGGGGASGDW